VSLNGTDLGAISDNDSATWDRVARNLTPRIIAELKRAARATGAFGR
jgi:hypothetical protein